MPTVCRVIGGAGTGKTTRAMRVLESLAEHGIGPDQVGFSSFTRAARGEAASRAADLYRCQPRELEQGGWFRTMHSIAYHCLGAGDVLADTRKDQEWIAEAIGRAAPELADYDAENFARASRPSQALALWGVARSRMEPLARTWDRMAAVGGAWSVPTWDETLQIVEAYEQAKRLDGREDFADLLSRYAGWKHSPSGGPSRCDPQGWVPAVRAWLLDEWQDSSALIQACADRIIEDAEYVYLFGDPFQSIYGWSGASPSHLMDHRVAKQDVLQTSYRCPQQIIDLGERILRQCTDYWDRGISASRPINGDPIERGIPSHLREIDPRDEWLVLARTNLGAAAVGKALTREGIPWRTIRGGGSRWEAPVRNQAVAALQAISTGSPIDGAQWKAILDQRMPAGLIERGVRARWKKLTTRAAQEEYPWIQIDALEGVGATPAFLPWVRSGAWQAEIEHAVEWLDASSRWGAEAMDELRVRVGTIHSAKGAEADNVALLTGSTRAVQIAATDPQESDQERRVEYVAVTRARHRLMVIDDRRDKYRMRLPLEC